ncbi:MAG: hypothetical protein MUP47_10785 [Phycisphaerae bacterium]|nr:hypothetical protein [Phycisphaerae bacterium]
MSRYVCIKSLTFDGLALPLPLSLRLSRQGQVLPAGGDDDLFATSVQLARPALSLEVRIRDSSAAEDLTLGQRGTLSFIVASASGQGARQVTVTGAVLTDVELSYEQIAPAVATLRFVAEADDGRIDPLQAEEAP